MSVHGLNNNVSIDTDDIRNAPALKIIEILSKEGARIKAYDPQAMAKTKNILPDIEYCEDPYSVIEGSEALLVCTEWGEFKELDPDKIKEKMSVPIVFDGRNVFDRNKMEEAGIKYFGVGQEIKEILRLKNP